MSTEHDTAGADWADKYVEQNFGNPACGMDDGRYDHAIVNVKRAADTSVAAIFARDAQRSEWAWFRFPDGSLVFGCYPENDTYFETEEDHTP